MPESTSTVLASLNQSLHRLMDDDPRVVVLGEDILDPYGGAFKVTRGLSSRFPGRVHTTPISEAAIVGLASGLAMRGLRPIVEIMFGDFLFLAGDQLVNHAAKFRWMYNDAVRVPLVVRTPMGGRRGYGPTHSQSIEKHFMGVPGLWVVAPHVLSSPGALLRQATLDCDDPVIFVESKTCYGRPLLDGLPNMTSTVLSDAAAPFPTMVLRHEGREADGVIWCYGGMVPHCIDAVRRMSADEGLFIDLAIPSQLSPMPSSHVHHIVDGTRAPLNVYVEESSSAHGWSADVLSCVQEHVDAAGGRAIRHVRIGGAHTPIASSRELEHRSLPQVDDIVSRVVESL